ncbi:hypothetical protein P280DRAFT_468363 [Massarina eburnea CBS 473.64]|uniref:Uncharacterized protein n=1 Tax=Massarina eburnea CBS 473.64 TaxID=1395130 RepID=A0A6A6S6R0_9PLEO|nr:hypothetical protein P280DRAFT_468363 [Massarina eburnea CBS 473.64]
MPYFRYFGPTAIMPGFKQMVVKVRGKQYVVSLLASLLSSRWWFLASLLSFRRWFLPF